jgi:hypothetical protein
MLAAAPLAPRDGDRSRLEALTRSTALPAGLAQRARIVLVAADGLPGVFMLSRWIVSGPVVDAIARPSDGATLLAAIVAAYEVVRRGSLATGNGRSRHGFHTTGSTGRSGPRQRLPSCTGLRPDNIVSC